MFYVEFEQLISTKSLRIEIQNILIKWLAKMLKAENYSYGILQNEKSLYPLVWSDIQNDTCKKFLNPTSPFESSHYTLLS